MSQVRVNITNREAEIALRRFAKEAGDLTPALESIGFALSQRSAGTFSDQRSPKGVPWTPLSPVTLALRRRKRAAGGEQILRDTGALANSITHEVSGRGVDVGSNLIYAAVQQFGNPDNKVFGRGSGPIPGRKFLPDDEGGGNGGLPASWTVEILQILQDHLEPAR